MVWEPTLDKDSEGLLVAPGVLAAVDGVKEWLAAPGAACQATRASHEVRFLPPQSFVDLYQLYRSSPQAPERAPPGRQLASYSWFLKVYRDQWKASLRIRHATHHSKCPKCEKFKEWRRVATSPEDVKAVIEAYSRHVASQYRDRMVDARVAGMAEQAARGETPTTRETSVVSICIDAMDQAKFRCPRHVSASKDFENLHRPELHCVGCLVDGVAEQFFLVGSRRMPT